MSESELWALGFLEWSILVHSSCQLSDALSLTVDWPMLQEVRPHARVQALLYPSSQAASTKAKPSSRDLILLSLLPALNWSLVSGLLYQLAGSSTEGLGLPQECPAQCFAHPMLPGTSQEKACLTER